MTFNTDLTARWATDIGTGKSSGDPVPCRGITGITPLSGSTNILCRVYTDATSPYIRVTNFETISAGTSVRLMIADVGTMVYGGVQEEILLSSRSITARIESPINETNATGPTASYDDLTITLPTFNGRSPAEYGGGDGKNIA